MFGSAGRRVQRTHEGVLPRDAVTAATAETVEAACVPSSRSVPGHATVVKPTCVRYDERQPPGLRHNRSWLWEAMPPQLGSRCRVERRRRVEAQETKRALERVCVFPKWAVVGVAGLVLYDGSTAELAGALKKPSKLALRVSMRAIHIVERPFVHRSTRKDPHLPRRVVSVRVHVYLSVVMVEDERAHGRKHATTRR